MVVRPVKALCDESGSVRSTQEYLAESRQQERPDRSQETSRAAAQWIAFGGLPRREWRTNIERTGAQLSDHQQRSPARHLMRDINPHLSFSVSFLTSPKKHPLYARPWKQWRLAGGEEERQGVDK